MRMSKRTKLIIILRKYCCKSKCKLCAQEPSLISANQLGMPNLVQAIIQLFICFETLRISEHGVNSFSVMLCSDMASTYICSTLAASQGHCQLQLIIQHVDDPFCSLLPLGCQSKYHWPSYLWQVIDISSQISDFMSLVVITEDNMLLVQICFICFLNI